MLDLCDGIASGTRSSSVMASGCRLECEKGGKELCTDGRFESSDIVDAEPERTSDARSCESSDCSGAVPAREDAAGGPCVCEHHVTDLGKTSFTSVAESAESSEEASTRDTRVA